MYKLIKNVDNSKNIGGNMRKIIAFAGSKGSGKTTAYETLKNNYAGVHDVTLAGRLKKVCSQVFNLDEKLFHDQKLKEVDLADFISLKAKDIEDIFILFGLVSDKDYNYDQHIRPHVGKMIETPRQLLQYIGTDVLHPIDPLIHANYVTKNLPEDGLVVITDLRFLNEFNYFYEKFKSEFVPFHINNLSSERAAEGDTHPSETDRHKFKHLCTQLDNNGTIYQFKGLVKTKIEELYRV